MRALGATALALCCVVVAVAFFTAGSANAAEAPSWRFEPKAAATYFEPGGPARYEVAATNVGNGPASEVTLSATLPAGVTFKSVTLYWSRFGAFPTVTLLFPGACSEPSGQEVVCKIAEPLVKFFGSIGVGQTVLMLVNGFLSVSAPEGPLVGQASVEGDGIKASGSMQNQVSAKPRYGLASIKLEPTERTEELVRGQDEYEFVNVPYRSPFTQAGGHPWALTATGELATYIALEGKGEIVSPIHDPKDVVTELPPGLLGDPMAVPRCPLSQVTSSSIPCPADTQVGVARLEWEGQGQEGFGAIINVTPEAGQSAEFVLENDQHIAPTLLTAHLTRTIALDANGTPLLDAQGKPIETYGFSVDSKAIPPIGLRKFELTFWGVPAESSHNAMRGRACGKSNFFEPLGCSGTGHQTSGVTPVPFVSMPTDCSDGPESVTVRTDSWREPGTVESDGRYSKQYSEINSPFPAVTGCEQLSFNQGTGIDLEPDTKRADSPVGLGVDLRVPLTEQPGTNTAPLLRSTQVTLPAGMSISPGVVDGIQACNATGPEGINITGPESEREGLDEELQLAPGHCPDASIVGTAEAITPYLPVPVKGHVYLARPGCGGAGQNPCTNQDALDGNLYKLYLELGGAGELANTGIEFKVPLQTQANPATGQLTATASELVQAPYSEVRIRLNGGPRAPIANPPQCGPASTTADLTPWSAPGHNSEGALLTGTPDSLSSSAFEVEGCPYPTPFAPGFVAGTVTPRAGQFSTFTMNLSRQDREQYVKGIQLHTPEGLLAMLSSVPLCQEPQADAGTCPEASRIGTTRVATGAGSHPFEIEGDVYLTGPYNGAPFGLSIVTHVVAGPFNLGLVVVRARIDIDPNDSTATITTDETGPYAVPQIVFGVPVRLHRITVNIDRPGFMFNPTDCKSLGVAARVSGDQGAVASVSSPFAAAGCKSLAFKPKFSVSTSGHTNRVKGASLDARVSYPAGAFGSDANIARVKVSLPKQLPSRLSTLQRACPAARFAADPATCPRGSIVGIARTRTPLLPVELEGPVYFVSHGGEAFPSLVVVLEGDNVRVDLTGTTFISEKTNVTTSTFKTVPDVPVDSFELSLPQGSDSALAAVGNLCKEAGKLKMPTEFVAQNGAVFKQTTQIQVSGCKAKAAQTARTGGVGGAKASQVAREHATVGKGGVQR